MPFYVNNWKGCCATWENVPSHMCVLQTAQSDLSLLSAGRNFASLTIQKRTQRRFWLDYGNAQADLNLCCTHMSESMFSNVAVHMFLVPQLSSVYSFYDADLWMIISYILSYPVWRSFMLWRSSLIPHMRSLQLNHFQYEMRFKILL